MHTVAGTSILLTMLVNIVAPHVMPLVGLLRRLCRRGPKSGIVTQHQMDQVRMVVGELRVR